jgi:hypothetical protein
MLGDAGEKGALDGRAGAILHVQDARARMRGFFG